MAWYPGAQKMELQPESDAQAAIRPTQFIVHSIVAPWTARRTYEYWRDSTNLESHFGLGYEGDLAQYIGTETRADANAGANRRPDGTGAVSIETASDTKASDPWTAEQVEQLIRLGVWMHEHHGLPLRICRSHDDPGFGYHSLFSQWATSGTACPGTARIAQFKQTVFPGIVARATGGTGDPQQQEEEAPVALADDDIRRLASRDGIWKAPKDAADYNPDPKHPGHYWSLGTHITGTTSKVRGLEKTVAQMNRKLDALTALVQQLADKEK
ncbi:peptidoglycan recognition protein family protein [Streptomyces hirsutus]|uniref:peptidoglycan recognition protein family protein n=1 Tax=Streptomyces hirsutus TaxID=35620 RepID=UPI00332EFE55